MNRVAQRRFYSSRACELRGSLLFSGEGGCAPRASAKVSRWRLRLSTTSNRSTKGVRLSLGRMVRNYFVGRTMRRSTTERLALSENRCRGN